jgi:hypothetical protein
MFWNLLSYWMFACDYLIITPESHPDDELKRLELISEALRVSNIG